MGKNGAFITVLSTVMKPIITELDAGHGRGATLEEKIVKNADVVQTCKF